jgi:hypothetical protein
MDYQGYYLSGNPRRRKTMKVRCEIEFEKPTGSTFEEIKEFILDALSSSGGNRHPSDPLFNSLKERLKIRWISQRISVS